MTDPQTAADVAEPIRRLLDRVGPHADFCLSVHAAKLRAFVAEHDALLADRKRMAAELEQVRGAVAEATGLLHRLAAPNPCSLDNDGACWVHDGYWPPCPHPRGRRFVEAWRTVQAEATERSDAEGAGKGLEGHAEASGRDACPPA